MKSVWRASRSLLALAVMATLAACESGDPLATPEPASQGTFETFEASVISQAEAAGIDPTDLPAEVPLMRGPGTRERVFVQGDVGDTSVEAVVGSRGGVLNLGQHWLLIPRDAVRGDVLFRMTPIGDGTFHVDLTATRLGGRETRENDVGETGFRRPVYLAFHFGDAAVDPSALEVAWLTSGGYLVSQPTYLYEEDWAVGVLRHFSGYVLVAN